MPRSRNDGNLCCSPQEFEALYAKYEREGRARKTIKAQQLWFAILEAQARARAGEHGGAAG